MRKIKIENIWPGGQPKNNMVLIRRLENIRSKTLETRALLADAYHSRAFFVYGKMWKKLRSLNSLSDLEHFIWNISDNKKYKNNEYKIFIKLLNKGLNYSKRALILDKNSKSANYSYLNILRVKGEQKEALKIFKKIFKKNDMGPSDYFNKTFIYISMGNFMKTINELSVLLKKAGPKDKRLVKQSKEIIKFLDKLGNKKITPEVMGGKDKIKNIIENSYNEEKKIKKLFQKSINIYKNLIELDPGNTKHYSNLANVYQHFAGVYLFLSKYRFLTKNHLARR